MTDELKFFILLLEKYAYDKNIPTADVLREWEEKILSRRYTITTRCTTLSASKTPTRMWSI